MPPGKTRDLLIVTAGYGLAVAVAAVTVLLVDTHPLAEVLLADVLATVVVFAGSVATRNSSFYDPYWSVTPPVIALYFAGLDGTAAFGRTLMVLAVIGLWSARLTVNWAYGWQGMHQEDWRYRNLAAASGRLWWPLSFAGVHLFPTLVVYLGCIALYPALTVGGEPLGWLDGVAFTLGIAAVWLEFEADRTLHRFRARRADRSQVLTSGVWGWCRHPNYLGEIGFWLSLFLFGTAAWGGPYPLSWLGPAGMMVLFLGVSIPMIERKLGVDKPAYADYRRRTRMLLPGLL